MCGVTIGLAFDVVDEETVGLSVLSHFGHYCVEVYPCLLVGLYE
jgi:hypothetical protein